MANSAEPSSVPRSAPATALAKKVVNQAYHNGLLLLTCGQSSIRFMPPLIVAKEHVDEAIAILAGTLDEVLAA